LVFLEVARYGSSVRLALLVFQRESSVQPTAVGSYPPAFKLCTATFGQRQHDPQRKRGFTAQSVVNQPASMTRVRVTSEPELPCVWDMKGRMTNPKQLVVPQRQPVHTVYGGAHLFNCNTAAKLGANARALVDKVALSAADFAEFLGISSGDGDRVRERVLHKLQHEPVEDLRIDFEDGYGRHSDAEEDQDCARVADELGQGHRNGTLPPFIGIRIKSFGAEATRVRGLRTLTQFIAAWATHSKAFAIPRPLRITLAKVQHPREVTLLYTSAEALCLRHGLDFNQLSFELMIETPAALLDQHGQVPLAQLVQAAHGKCVGLHFGAYDYLSSLGVASTTQSLHHTYCHDARTSMVKVAAGTHIAVVDGATTQLPLLMHREAQGPAEHAANRHAVTTALATHAWDISVSLSHGFYQSWDLHPGQLISRYGAVYAFFQEGLPSTVDRLVAFLDNHRRATAAAGANHGAFDDAATVRGHAEFLLRGLRCSAFSDDEQAALNKRGIVQTTIEELAANAG
jgi:citrate lyase beta subunit